MTNPETNTLPAQLRALARTLRNPSEEALSLLERVAGRLEEEEGERQLNVHSMNFEKKAWDIALEGGPARMVAGALVRTFHDSGATNFSAFSMAVKEAGSAQWYDVLIQKRGGETPAEQAGRYRKALEQIEVFCRHSDEMGGRMRPQTVGNIREAAHFALTQQEARQ